MSGQGVRVAVAAFVGTLVATVQVSASPAAPEPSVRLERALAEFDQAQQILGAHPDRARRLFRSAAQRLERIVTSGVVNGRLEFNLGNCYLQAGDVGKAILHYRRALRLIPRDPLLANNLAEARSRCLTAIPPTRRSALLRSVFFWHYDTSSRERARATGFFYVAFWLLLTLRSFLPRRRLTAVAIICGILTVTLASSVAADLWNDRQAPAGVVTAMDVAVYKGPGTGYRRQFEQPLQPAVEFTLREVRGGWWHVELADGKSGWIGADTGELIVPSADRQGPRAGQIQRLDW